tara:strand:- start:871 stop:1452 length:582 start_codon:yes stop_codon:yes gene_type:complete
MSKVSSHKRIVKGKWKYFVNDKSFDDENKARSYYDQLKGGGALGASKKIAEIDDELKEIKKRTQKNQGKISSYDEGLKKKLLKQQGGLYAGLGIDTTGFSNTGGDASVPVSGTSWYEKVGSFFKGLTKNNEGQKLAERINALSAEYRALRAQGKLPPEIKPNEINAYARAQAKAELKAYKENPSGKKDTLGIR